VLIVLVLGAALLVSARARALLRHLNISSAKIRGGRRIIRRRIRRIRRR
jgi:hypothetical protein